MMKPPTNIPPHIPHDAENLSTENKRVSPLMYLGITLIVGSLSGFVASLFYAAYGPSANSITTIPQQRVEHVANIIDERAVKNTQDAIVTFTGDKTEQVFGYGTAITGDGWFIAPISVVKSKHVLMHPQTLGTIQKIVVDPASNLVFIKTSIMNARLLGYASLDSIGRGSQLSIVMPQTVIPVTLQETNTCIAEKCPIEHGDKISFAATIVETLPQFNLDGAPVITASGDLVGIAEHSNGRVIIIPIDELRPVFSSVFANNVATRPQFQIHAINITRWSIVDLNDTLPLQGMLVESPAVAPLKEGDIITAIEHQPIESDTTLFDTAEQLKSLGHTTMSVLRKGSATPIDVIVPIKQ
ncbi:MAG: S1C family serine protease [Candidatus Magasanikbacteria bacterium]|nr:S1C family serine protease [Candidatus Magasanikbacteria bacterium]